MTCGRISASANSRRFRAERLLARQAKVHPENVSRTVTATVHWCHETPLLLPLLCLTALLLSPSPAAADGTPSLASPDHVVRSANARHRLKMLVVGWNSRYAHVNDGHEDRHARFTSGMSMCWSRRPQRRVYLTAGGAVTHEDWGLRAAWAWGRISGGGLKIRSRARSVRESTNASSRCIERFPALPTRCSNDLRRHQRSL